MWAEAMCELWVPLISSITLWIEEGGTLGN